MVDEGDEGGDVRVVGDVESRNRERGEEEEEEEEAKRVSMMQSSKAESKRTNPDRILNPTNTAAE